ncbi:MAG: hypothetical protein R2724_12955 [Bryobacterales bacterium]
MSADRTVVDQLLRRLIELAVTALQAHLDHQVRVSLMQGAQPMHLFGFEDQRLFAENVLAGFERRLRNWIVHVQRDG